MNKNNKTDKNNAKNTLWSKPLCFSKNASGLSLPTFECLVSKSGRIDAIKNNITAIKLKYLIKNKEITEGYKKYFELMWRLAKD